MRISARLRILFEDICYSKNVVRMSVNLGMLSDICIGPIVLMSSLAYSCIAHVCGIKGVGSRIARGRSEANIMQDGTADLSASKATTPSKGFLPKKRLTSPYYF